MNAEVDADAFRFSYTVATLKCPVSDRFSVLIAERGWTIQNGCAIQELHITFRERIYPPFLTLCVCLWQVLSEDHPCREAVARLIGFRIANGQRPCSPDTNPYCRARKQLPEKLFQLLVQKVGQWLQKHVPESWLFHGRHVKSVDGTTVSMPDTPANQKDYPQKKTQKPGVWESMARPFCFVQRWI